MTREAVQREFEQRKEAVPNPGERPTVKVWLETPTEQPHFAHITPTTSGHEMVRSRGSLMHYNYYDLYLVCNGQIVSMLLPILNQGVKEPDTLCVRVYDDRVLLIDNQTRMTMRMGSDQEFMASGSVRRDREYILKIPLRALGER